MSDLEFSLSIHLMFLGDVVPCEAFPVITPKITVFCHAAVTTDNEVGGWHNLNWVHGWKKKKTVIQVKTVQCSIQGHITVIEYA